MNSLTMWDSHWAKPSNTEPHSATLSIGLLSTEPHWVSDHIELHCTDSVVLSTLCTRPVSPVNELQCAIGYKMPQFSPLRRSAKRSVSRFNAPLLRLGRYTYRGNLPAIFGIQNGNSNNLLSRPSSETACIVEIISCERKTGSALRGCSLSVETFC